MNETTPEPLDAILAEFRTFALRAAEEDKTISPESVLLLADKVEAAAKREALDAELKWTRIGYDERKAEEKRAPGNAAAMREALEDSLRFWNGITSRTRREENLRLEIDAALAAPARNCDVGTADEQAERFEAECKRHNNCSSCQIHAAWGEFKEGKPKSCQTIWGQMLFAPAKGENKQ